MGVSIVDAFNIKNVDDNFKGFLNLFISEIKFRHNREFKLSKIDIEIHDGKRYVKVVETRATGKNVHSFVEKETGKIFKAASWSAPANKERGSIYDQGGLSAFGNDWQIRYL